MKEKLVSIVKKRFGSMTRFADLAGIEYYQLQKLFSAWNKKETPERKERFKALIQQARTIPNNTIGRDLTPEKRAALKEAIEAVGGVGKFCTDNVDANGKPLFNTFSVWQILSGRRKTISPAVKKIFETLKIEL